MQGLTPEGQKIVEDIARRHGFSAEATAGLLGALAAGNGTQAQFNHPEFGGMGQWSQGGMIMIGDMFNNGLKARVDALCRDLADLLRDQQVFAPSGGGRNFMAVAELQYFGRRGQPVRAGLRAAIAELVAGRAAQPDLDRQPKRYALCLFSVGPAVGDQAGRQGQRL